VVRVVNGKVKETFTDDPGGTGAETTAEVLACPACAVSPQRAAAVRPAV
jgi:hypothetical protein